MKFKARRVEETVNSNLWTTLWHGTRSMESVLHWKTALQLGIFGQWASSKSEILAITQTTLRKLVKNFAQAKVLFKRQNFQTLLFTFKDQVHHRSTQINSNHPILQTTSAPPPRWDPPSWGSIKLPESQERTCSWLPGWLSMVISFRST